MSSNDKEFEEIVQSIKSDESFIRQTNKISSRPVGGRALTLGIIMALAGICLIPVSISLLEGFWELLAGALAFCLAVYGAMITHGAWGTVGMKNRTTGSQSKFMQKINARWDKHVEESGR